MLDQLKEYRDAALRRVGRNVVNFQRLESALRALIPALNASGTLSDFNTRLAESIRELKKKPLGHLASTFHAQVHDSSEYTPLLTDPSEASFAVAFRLETDPHASKERKRTLLSLVRERNRLIHTELGRVNFDSIADCERLSSLLDEQNHRICEQLDSLKQLRATHLALTAELKQFIDSDEFLEIFTREIDGALTGQGDR